jgi:hypothetical protein
MEQRTRTVFAAIGDLEIEECLSRLRNVSVTESDPDIDIITDTLNYARADYVIVNTLLSKAKSQALARAAKEKGVLAIAIVEDMKDAEFIALMAGSGVRAFLEPDELYKIQDYIDDYPASFDFSRLGSPVRDRGAAPLKAPWDRGKTTVAVLGAMPRIGATTQALRLARALLEKNYRAAIIAAQRDGYAESLAACFEGAENDAAREAVRYAGLELYYNPDRIGEIYEQDYQYYIYDFGSAFARPPAGASWQEKDLKIVVAGAKANELPYLRPALKEFENKKATFIFSFTSEKERAEIRESMARAAKEAYFAEYSPDPFAPLSEAEEALYESVLRLSGSGAERRGIFGIFHR